MKKWDFLINFQSLPYMINLRILKVNSYVMFDESTAQAISSCTSLKVLHMQDYFPTIRIVGMRFIAELTNHEVLNVAKNVLVNDDFLKAIGSKCKKLIEINVNGNYYFLNQKTQNFHYILFRRLFQEFAKF